MTTVMRGRSEPPFAPTTGRRPRGRQVPDLLLYALVAPLTLFIIGLALVPAAFTIVQAFFKVQPLDPPDRFNGLDNFRQLFGNTAVTASMANTALYVVIVAVVLDATRDLLGRAPDAKAIGLVVPGLVDDANGVGVYSENIGWRNVPFRSLVEAMSGLPVGFGHDVRASGLAERTSSAAQGVNDVLFMPIGTGISGADILARRALATSLTDSARQGASL